MSVLREKKKPTYKLKTDTAPCDDNHLSLQLFLSTQVVFQENKFNGFINNLNATNPYFYSRAPLQITRLNVKLKWRFSSFKWAKNSANEHKKGHHKNTPQKHTHTHTKTDCPE